MSALMAFAEAHPWWTLVYLLVLSSLLRFRISFRGDKDK